MRLEEDMAKEFDFIVLGSGNAAAAAARVAIEAGKSVAMIESGDVGGTCAPYFGGSSDPGLARTVRAQARLYPG